MNFFVMSAILIFSRATLCACYNVSPKRSGLRIVNGHDVSPGQFPYVVRIEVAALTHTGHVFKYYHLCTGAAITPIPTLTAGHCYEKEYQVSDMAKHVVRYGSTPGKPDEKLDKFSDVLNIVRPPAAWEADHPFFTDDLAIFKTEPILLKTYGKISSLDYPSLFGLHVNLMGYGNINRSNDDTLILNLPLQVVDGMMIQCGEKWIDDYTFPLLCVKSACGTLHAALGPGDSGAPVVHSTGIVGTAISGFTHKDNPENIPPLTQGYIMAISPYIDWLTRTFKETSNS